MRQFILILLVSLLCAACAGNGQPNQRQGESADPELEPEAVSGEPRKVSVDEYIAFLDELKAAVERGEIREFSSNEYRSFQRIDRRLRSELANVDHIEQLAGDNKIRVYNLHQELQGVIIGDPENFQICRREHTVGTNFRRTRCISAGEFRRNQEENRRQLRQLMGPGPMPQQGTP